MRTAKELFQATPAFKDHFTALLDNPAFEPACQAALADLSESLPNSGDVSKSWDCYSQLIGARAVLQKLSQLNSQDPQPRPEPPSWQYPKGK